MNKSQSRFSSNKPTFVAQAIDEEQPWTAWKRAIRLYAASVTMIFVLPFLFYFTKLQKDVMCQLAYEGYGASNYMTNPCLNVTVAEVNLPTMINDPDQLY